MAFGLFAGLKPVRIKRPVRSCGCLVMRMYVIRSAVITRLRIV